MITNQTLKPDALRKNVADINEDVVAIEEEVLHTKEDVLAEVKKSK